MNACCKLLLDIWSLLGRTCDSGNSTSEQSPQQVFTGRCALAEGEEVEVKGSGKSIYKLKRRGGMISCTCPGTMIFVGL